MLFVLRKLLYTTPACGSVVQIDNKHQALRNFLMMLFFWLLQVMHAPWSILSA